MKTICRCMLVGLTILVAGCGSNPSPAVNTETEAAPRNDISVSVSPAPPQPTNSREPVSFDPCAEISDKTISQAGYSPETRKRIDQVHDGWAFIGCTFKRIETVRTQQLGVAHLTILSSNISVDEIRAKESARTTVSDTRVNSRSGIAFQGEGMGSCDIAIPGPDSALSIQVSSLGLTDWDACAEITQTAAAIESTLPD
ncbi:DUF3558 domain-containing protein [Nocardia sp. NPDC060259]|uniref:DUF3558 domain-containing protein n=1 Tax=Nocardia sp. NPDC060259 TaxID=3347088 RepID=UPI003650489B